MRTAADGHPDRRRFCGSSSSCRSCFTASTPGPRPQTLLFVLSVLAIVPLAALLSRTTESVAEHTGDAVGGLLNATLGNLTELVIAFTALQAGQYALVKASIAGAIVTNTLFMLGGAFLLGGLQPPHPGIQPGRCAVPVEPSLRRGRRPSRPLDGRDGGRAHRVGPNSRR